MSSLKELCAQNLQGDINIESVQTTSPGVGIVLWTRKKILGADMLGEKGLPAEQLGQNVVKTLCTEIKAKVDLDEHLVDQLLPYLAICEKRGSFSCRHLSNHALTEMWLLPQFLDVKFDIQTSDISRVTIKKEREHP